MEFIYNTEYKWDRLWCKQDSFFALDESGFLFDPDTKDSFYRKTDVVKYAEINHLNSLILLGEPGIGKSTTLRTRLRHSSLRSPRKLKSIPKKPKKSPLYSRHLAR